LEFIVDVIIIQTKAINNVARTRILCTPSQNTWQLREFKTDINSQGEVVFVSDTVKSNPLARLFANEERSLGNGKLDPYSPIDPLPANQGNLVLVPTEFPSLEAVVANDKIGRETARTIIKKYA
jgi:hypothetical protein